MDKVIVFEGDYIRDTDGVVAEVVAMCNWDENGDADISLANGRCIHTSDITIDMVLCESEIIG